MITFPPSPPHGTTRVGPGQQVWRWDGRKWGGEVAAGGLDIALPLSVANGGTGATSAAGARNNLGIQGAFLPLTGGTVTGQIKLLVDPEEPDDVTNKKYVDWLVSELRLFEGTWQVGSNSPNISNWVSSHGEPISAGNYFIAVTANPNEPEQVPAGVPGIAGQWVHNGDMIIWDANTNTYEIVRGSPLTKIEADEWYISKDGDTMEGPLTLHGSAVLPWEATPLEQVQYLIAEAALGGGEIDLSAYLLRSGGTMTGHLNTIPPFAGTNAANKNYVDWLVSELKVFEGVWDVASNTPNLLGWMSAGGMPISAGNYFIARTVDPNVPERPPVAPSIPGLPSLTTLIHNGDMIIWDSNLSQYEVVRGSPLTKVEADELFVSKDGDEMRGSFLLHDNAISPLEAVPLRQVQLLISQAELGGGGGGEVDLSAYLPLIGGSMLGHLNTIPPVNGTNAANKNYVDWLVSELKVFEGVWDVATNTPNLVGWVSAGGAAISAGNYFIARTADPNIPERPPVSPVIPGLPRSTTLIHNGDMIIWDANLNQYEVVRGSPLTKIEADELFVSKDGDEMRGALALHGDANSELEAVPLRQVSFLIEQAAISAGEGGIPEAPSLPSGAIFGRSAGSWSRIDNLYLPLAGGTLGGAVSLHGDATTALEPVPLRQLERDYVSIANIDNYVSHAIDIAVANGEVGLPIGTVVDYASDIPPQRWLACDGRALSRTQYAKLFAAIGTQWGTGNGSTTFNIPDARARITVGFDPESGTGRVTIAGSTVNPGIVGSTGGSQFLYQHTHTFAGTNHTHTFTGTEHTHGFTGSNHTHGINDPAHTHGVGDPGHAHVVTPHQHPIWDPGHGHGLGDPGHAHLYTMGADFGGGTGTQPIYQPRYTGGSDSYLQFGSYASGTGMWVGASGTGTVADWNGAYWTDDGGGRGTGIWIGGNYTGISVLASSSSGTVGNGTGGGTNSNTAAEGTNSETGIGTSQNMPPVVVFQKIIFTGVLL